MWLKYDSSLRTEDGSLVPIPVHYEMKGYNTLLGSHYDHYYVTYSDFRPVVLDHSHVFDIFLKKNCHGWPGPGIDHTYTMNPMREFINNDDQHVRDTFDEFKDKHEKRYDDMTEHEQRLDTYRQNMRFIHSKNRQGEN